MSLDTHNGLRLKKGAWTADEDMLLKNYIQKYGEGKWHRIPLKTGLNRCRKSCRIRWMNYLRPNIKRGNFGEDEIDLIRRLHKLLGNRWSLIAGRIPGRTANDVKNYWNTHIRSRSIPEKKEPNASLPDSTTVTVIKPQAQNISKTVNCYENQHNMVDNRERYQIRLPDDGANNDFNLSSGLLPSSTSALGDEINKCLDVLFDDREIEFDGHGVWSFGDSPVIDGYALNVVEQEDYNSSLFDFQIDEVVWNLKSSDQLSF